MVEIKIKINDERDQRTILKTKIPDSGFLDLSPGQKSKSTQSIVVVFNKGIVNINLKEDRLGKTYRYCKLT